MLSRYQQDTQLVSILYRTHKSLSGSAKISSLYVFDALCRAARHQVTKQGLTGDINSEKGNCATFLLKVEGVLDGLIQDMISTGSSEAKVSLVTIDLCSVIVGWALPFSSWSVDLELLASATPFATTSACIANPQGLRALSYA